MGISETLRAVIEAGNGGKRLDELSTARIICDAADQLHAAHQKAGLGKSIGPLTPGDVSISDTGDVSIAIAGGTGAIGYSAP